MLAPVCVVAWAIGAALARVFGLWIAVGATAIVLGIICLVSEGKYLRDLPRRGVVIGSVAGAAMTIATHVLYAPFAHAWPTIVGDAATLYGHFYKLPLTLSLPLLTPIIVCEELVWRGVVQGAMTRRMSVPSAALSTAIMYTLAHAPAGSVVLTLAALGCGVVWSSLRAMTGGLVAPLVAHLIWDFSVLVFHPISVT